MLNLGNTVQQLVQKCDTGPRLQWNSQVKLVNCCRTATQKQKPVSFFKKNVKMLDKSEDLCYNISASKPYILKLFWNSIETLKDFRDETLNDTL